MFLMQEQNYQLDFANIARKALHLKWTPNMQRMVGSQGLTFRANNTHIVKFALNDNQIQLLQNTVALLNVLRPYLKDRTPVHVPNMTETIINPDYITATNSEKKPIYVVSYPILSGEIHRNTTFSNLKFRCSLMQQLGEFIGHLHKFPYRHYPNLNIPNYKSELAIDLPAIVTEVTDEKPSFKQQLLNSVCRDTFSRQTKVLCHYDAMPRNICLNKNKTRIVGIFDFASTIIAPRSYETMNTDYDIRDLIQMDKGYNRITGKTLLLSRKEIPMARLVASVYYNYERLKYRN